MSSNQTSLSVFPRFYRRSYPRSVGITVVLISGVLLTINIAAMIQDESIAWIIITLVLSVIIAAAFAAGVLSILASVEKIRFTPEKVQILLGSWVVFTIPGDQVRSVVATTREYRQKMNDQDIYLLRLYWSKKHPNWPLFFQWSQETEAALRENYPNADLLL